MALSFPVNLVKIAGMFVTGNGQQINQGDLPYVGQKGDGLDLFPKIQALFPGATLTFGPPPFWAYQYQSIDGGITDFWQVLGTWTDPSTGLQYTVQEFTGELADRATHPNPFIDHDGNQTGKNLKMKIASPPVDGYPGNTQVYYGV